MSLPLTFVFEILFNKAELQHLPLLQSLLHWYLPSVTLVNYVDNHTFLYIFYELNYDITPYLILFSY